MIEITSSEWNFLCSTTNSVNALERQRKKETERPKYPFIYLLSLSAQSLSGPLSLRVIFFCTPSLSVSLSVLCLFVPFCLVLSLSISLSFSVSLSFSPSLCFSMFLSVSLSLPLSFSFYLSLSLFHLFSVCLSVSLQYMAVFMSASLSSLHPTYISSTPYPSPSFSLFYLFLSLSLYLCVCVCLSISFCLDDSLRES